MCYKLKEVRSLFWRDCRAHDDDKFSVDEDIWMNGGAGLFEDLLIVEINADINDCAFNSRLSLDGTIGDTMTSNRDSLQPGVWTVRFGESFNPVPQKQSTLV